MTFFIVLLVIFSGIQTAIIWIVATELMPILRAHFDVRTEDEKPTGVLNMAALRQKDATASEDSYAEKFDADHAAIECMESLKRFHRGVRTEAADGRT